MPRIPQVVNDVPGRPAEQSMGAAQAPGAALANVGQDVSAIGDSIFKEQKQLNQSRQLMETNALAADAVDTFYRKTISDPTIANETLPDTVKQGIQKIHDDLAKQITDPQVLLHFNDNFQGVSDGHLSAARGVQYQRSVDDYKAGVKASIDQYVNLAATGTPEMVDHYKSQIVGILSNAVSTFHMSKVEAQTELDTRLGQIDHANASAAMQNDPAETAADLRLNKWPSIPPVERETLASQADRLARTRQRDTDAFTLKQQEAAQKQLKIEGDAQFARDTALADVGQLSHEQLMGDRLKYSWGEEAHVLDSRIDNPRELPSVSQSRDDVAIKVAQWPPAITQQQIAQMTRSATNPNGTLSGQDAARFITDIANKTHQIDKEGPSPTQQRSAATANVKNALANTDAYAPAISELNHNFQANPTGDPIAMGDAVIKKYQANAVNIKPFNSAMDALKKAKATADQFPDIHYVMSDFLKNPKLEFYTIARDKALKEAETAHRIIANAPANTPDWTRKTWNIAGPSFGKSVVVLNGKYVVE